MLKMRKSQFWIGRENRRPSKGQPYADHQPKLTLVRHAFGFPPEDKPYNRCNGHDSSERKRMADAPRHTGRIRQGKAYICQQSEYGIAQSDGRACDDSDDKGVISHAKPTRIVPGWTTKDNDGLRAASGGNPNNSRTFADRTSAAC